MFGPGGLPGMPGGPESGRWGDYVFNQEGTSVFLFIQNSGSPHDWCTALDHIISQIMENSNAHQPVPASEEVTEKLPRVVLEEGCMSVPLSSSQISS